jgi:hypothetical protein
MYRTMDDRLTSNGTNGTGDDCHFVPERPVPSTQVKGVQAQAMAQIILVITTIIHRLHQVAKTRKDVKD